MAENPRKLLYLSLHDKLSGLVDKKLIRYVGRWNNQIDNESEERASIAPNVLIQIDNKIKGTTASSYDLQEGEVIVTCHIGINVVKVDIGTLDWEIMQAVYETLQGECAMSDTYYEISALDRLDEIEDSNYDGYYHGKVIFCAYLKDYTKSDSRDTLSGSFTDLNGTVNDKLEI